MKLYLVFENRNAMDFRSSYFKICFPKGLLNALLLYFSSVTKRLMFYHDHTYDTIVKGLFSHSGKIAYIDMKGFLINLPCYPEL